MTMLKSKAPLKLRKPMLPAYMPLGRPSSLSHQPMSCSRSWSTQSLQHPHGCSAMQPSAGGSREPCSSALWHASAHSAICTSGMLYIRTRTHLFSCQQQANMAKACRKAAPVQDLDAALLGGACHGATWEGCSKALHGRQVATGCAGDGADQRVHVGVRVQLHQLGNGHASNLQVPVSPPVLGLGMLVVC